MKKEAKKLKELFQSKRTYREFSSTEIPIEVITDCIGVALRAPSGANQQPWTFCVVSDIAVKTKIREESEKQEELFYAKENLAEWHQELAHLEVNTKKPFLSEAPYLICIFYHKANADGSNTYYASKSTGLASGMLIGSLHQVGLSSLTYTPQNMKFLNQVLSRPDYEVPYLILAVGEKDLNYKLPDITKKSEEETIIYY